MHQQHHRRLRKRDDGLHVENGIKGKRGQRRLYTVTGRHIQQGVAIRHRLHDIRRAHVAARARTVFNDDRIVESLG